MPNRTLKSKIRRYRNRNQPYYPGIFKLLDLTVEGSKLLLIAVVFGTIFYTI